MFNIWSEEVSDLDIKAERELIIELFPRNVNLFY